jgi:PAS domain S-box-containing protein
MASELRRLVEALPGLVWTARPDGSAEFLSHSWRDYTGMALDELARFGWRAAIHPDDLPLLAERWRKLVEAGNSGDIEARLRRHDGEYRWFRFSCSAMKDKAGRIIKWCGVNTDIDEDVRAKAIAASERDLRLIVDSIPGMVTVFSAAGELEFVSNKVIEYFGVPPEEHRNWQTNGFTHPEDAVRTNEAFARAIASGEPFELEVRARRHDGVYCWFQSRGTPLKDESGRIVRWYNLLIDIDDRKRAEAELKRSEAFMAEGQRLSSTGTFLWYPDSNEMTFSEELYRIHEIDPDLPMDSALHMSRTHPDDVPLVYATAARFQREGGVIIYESRLRMPDGRIKYVSTFGREIVDQDGRRACLGVCQDLTAKKLAEEAINRARTELAHVARVSALGELTASIAHEVNQPLAGIMTNADICLQMLDIDPPDIAEARATAQRTLRDGARASEVIKRLRAMFSRKDPTSEAVDLCGATREVLALSAGQLQAARVSVQIELPDELPKVLGDRIQLQQVILNLVLNAADAMREVEQTRRKLVLAAAPDGTERIVFSVRDVGVGLGPGSPEKVFETFYTTKPEGMGIGLSVSRSIVERHGGSLWASSNEDGPGATFRFAIPCAPAATGGDHPKSKRGRSGVHA